MKTFGSVLAGILIVSASLLGVAVAHRLEETKPPQFSALPLSDPGAIAVDAGAPQAGAVTVFGEQVVIIGDFTYGSDQGGRGNNNWTVLVGGLVSQNRPVRIVTDSSSGGGSGYVARGSGLTFPDQIKRLVSPATGAVVISGSRNDILAPPAEVRAAASETYQEVAAIAPSARLIVIGPTWPDNDPPRQLLSIRDVVRSAATEAGATFVDPIADRWLSDGTSGLVGSDNVQPTDEGHIRIANLMAPVITGTLERSE